MKKNNKGVFLFFLVAISREIVGNRLQYDCNIYGPHGPFQKPLFKSKQADKSSGHKFIGTVNR